MDEKLECLVGSSRWHGGLTKVILTANSGGASGLAPAGRLAVNCDEVVAASPEMFFNEN